MHPWKSLFISLMVIGLMPGSAGLPSRAEPAAGESPVPVTSVAEMVAGSDWERDPLEIDLLRAWDHDGVHFEELFFTGPITHGVKTRVHAFRGAPVSGAMLPGMLHAHGGGGSASLEAVKFWAERGYVCVSFDYQGPLPGRTRFTDFGAAILGQREGRPAGPGDVPNARWNFWYGATAAGCRAVTLLAQDPRVDRERIGAYGISAGGYLCWMMAAADARLKTIVPLYGNAAGIYRDRKTQKRLEIGDPEAFDRDAFARHPEAPELHAPLIRCPVLFMTATNDGFDLDESFDTLDSIGPPAPAPRLLLTPRWVHHMEPAESRALPIWMAWHLKGEGRPWPVTPKAAFVTDGPIPVVTVHPADPDDVSEVSIHVSLDNPKGASRFWREVPVTRVGDSCVGDSCDGDSWTGETPFTRSGETLYAFATVSYGSGARLSSRVIELSTATLPERPTLVPTRMIDPMEDDRGWYWVPAYTEPLTYDHYFLPWTGPDGTRGFTLNTCDFLLPPGPDNRIAFDIATQRLGDPQWRGTGQTRLLIDIWAPHAPLELTVRAVERWYQPDARDFFFQPQLPPHTDPGWVTLELDAARFRDKEGNVLGDWGAIQVLDLIGVADATRPPVWANLRWADRPLPRPPSGTGDTP